MLGAQASLAVQAELSLLATALRRAPPHSPDQTRLAQECQRARSRLREPHHHQDPSSPPEWLPPFLAAVRSEKTPAAPTAMALAALHKFLSYGLIDPTHPSTPITVENIADAVTHARFVGTDHSSDGVVLIKMLQVLRTLLLSPEGAMLTGDSVCEIMLSCFRICFETRLSELLRRNADQCLRDMIQHVFMRLPQFSVSVSNDEDAKDYLITSNESIDVQRKNSTASHGKTASTSHMADSIRESYCMELNESDSGISNQNVAKSETAEPTDSVSPCPPGKSPLKKHGRHSSMDLASSDNIFISQLVEKCVSSDSPEQTKTESRIEDAPNEIAPSDEPKDQIEEPSEDDGKRDDQKQSDDTFKDFINPMGVRFIPYDEHTTLQPYGVPCIKELLRFLISLCNPMDNLNSTSMVHLGLCLIQTALEVTADHFAQHPSILQLIKDSLCRNLLSLLNSERVPIFALDLQVSFLLFESLRTHLKLQMESFFLKLIEIVVTDNNKNSYESKEITYLALESISQMWRVPGLCTELYLNYDCDVYCTNLFEDTTKLLSKSIVVSGYNNYHSLALDALKGVIESIEANCHPTKSNESSDREEENEEESETDKKYISIDMEGCEVSSDITIRDISQYIGFGTTLSRHRASSVLPSLPQLLDIKNKKRWIATGTELFNQKPEKGIEFLQEHGILSVPLDPLEIAHFLRNNPGLDKKMIGEYISKKKNVESRILATYASSFDMTGLRIDQALRLYLETFRLPGEAPLIFLVMEHFAEHWHNCNGQPFANTDAAFRLAYAIIMLNMDQHNHNAKKLNVPMVMEEFVRNLRGCNGNGDFDQTMLEAVFNAIKNEEIVMPAEHTGIVKENYLWKVLLRRGLTKEGTYHHCPNGIYDAHLFMVMWGPMIAALSSIFEKSHETELYTQAIEGFDMCASIVGHFSLSNELDTLILSLCKFTGLLTLPEQTNYIYLGTSFGQNVKAQMALKKVFGICHRHADSIREGWKHVLDIILALFKAHLLPKSLVEVDDFCSPSGKISLINVPSQQTKAQEPGLLSSLYSYIASSSESNTFRIPNPEEAAVILVASECVKECNVDTLLLTDSKFLHLDSLQELVKYLIQAGKVTEGQSLIKSVYNEDPIVFFLELLIKVVIQNRDRVSHVWKATEVHVVEMLKSSAELTHQVLMEKYSYNNVDRTTYNANTCQSSNMLERSSTGLLRLAINLMRNEECASDVLRSLKSFLDLNYLIYHHIAGQIAIGLFELVKTSAQNIHSAEDWGLVFVLLETTGAGAMHLKQDSESGAAGSRSDGAVSSEDESVSTDRGYTSEGELSHSPPSQGWILVTNDTTGSSGGGGQGNLPPINPLVHPCSLRPHDPNALLKCWECLAFIVRDVAHITPYNFESCVNCIRTFVEASLHGVNESKVTTSSHLVNKDGKRRKQSSHIRRNQRQFENRSGSREDIDSPEGYHLISIQLLDLMHTLHSRTAQIFKWWREEATFSVNSGSQELSKWCNLWHLAWRPLLQGISRLCTDNRKQVSSSAVTYLQRALLVHDLQTLSGEEWEACFHRVLFPLLSQLTHHHDEIRLRANTIMCKVFLHHLTPLLGRPSFSNLWLSLLDLMRSLMTGANTTDLLYEATLESLKNMLLVMDSVKVFSEGDGYSELWGITWDRINAFLPKLRQELFKPIENPKHSVPQNGLVQESNPPPPPPPALPFNEPPGGEVPPTSPNKHPDEQQTVSPPSIAAGYRNSIILQPPSGSQIHSPLFSHLGQMVSTPIGVATPMATPYPVLCPTSSRSVPVSPQRRIGADVPTPPPPPHIPDGPPRSLYGEYLTNPYNSLESSSVTSAELADGTNTFNFSKYFSSPEGAEAVPPGAEVFFDGDLRR